MKKILSILALAVLASMILTACGKSKDAVVEKPDDGRLEIVTTIAPLYSLTAYLIEGTNVKLKNILPPNVSVHDYQLTTKTLKDLSDADLVVMNGLGLEGFLEDSMADLDASVVQTAIGVELLENADELEGQFNPHVWLSPKNAVKQAENITRVLVKLDAMNAAIYQANLEKLKEKIILMDEGIKTRFAALDLRPYVVFHDAYPYFEENFAVHAAAFLEEFPGKESSAQYLAEIVEIIKANSVEVIFAEPQFSPKLVQTLAKDYNLKTAELDPDGTEVSKDAYFKMMEGNIQSFEKVFAKK